MATANVELVVCGLVSSAISQEVENDEAIAQGLEKCHLPAPVVRLFIITSTAVQEVKKGERLDSIRSLTVGGPEAIRSEETIRQAQNLRLRQLVSANGVVNLSTSKINRKYGTRINSYD
ncbi:hypothetical protein C8F04DRAFT_1240361 [Mycena alexandri]|uniref:Uncharacterized protein n=1 Tax=Mycena alexandri TaxID=1745969 RepID=A0AAD6WS68_9AGAR|nr:hypothetical protein C8F04DRAFT_1240361 [Mycena alexandri]